MAKAKPKRRGRFPAIICIGEAVTIRRNGRPNSFKMRGECWPMQNVEGAFVFGIGAKRFTVKPINGPKQNVRLTEELKGLKVRKRKYRVVFLMLRGHAVERNGQPQNVIVTAIE